MPQKLESSAGRHVRGYGNSRTAVDWLYPTSTSRKTPAVDNRQNLPTNSLCSPVARSRFTAFVHSGKTISGTAIKTFTVCPAGCNRGLTMGESEHHHRNPPNTECTGVVRGRARLRKRHASRPPGAPRFSGTGSPAVCPYPQPCKTPDAGYGGSVQMRPFRVVKHDAACLTRMLHEPSCNMRPQGHLS